MQVETPAAKPSNSATSSPPWARSPVWFASSATPVTWAISAIAAISATLAAAVIHTEGSRSSHGVVPIS